MSRRIQNFEALATSELRTDALEIAEAGYAAIHTDTVIRNRVQITRDELHICDKTFSLSGRKIFFVGIGKCAIAAAETIEKVLGDRLVGGIAFDVSPVAGTSLTKIETLIGTHPLPSEANVQATKHIVEFLSGREESDLVIMLISGGGSTLLCLPEAPMTCLDESTLWNELTAHGAGIQDINTVRKHISRARGGGLAAAAYPAEVVSLIISDVPGNDIEYIASGPTIADSSTIADAQDTLARYGLATGTTVAFLETPKEEKYFARVTNILFLTNQDALKAMQSEAEQRGYKTEIVDDHFAGEAQELGRAITEKLHTTPAKTVLLYAGESTVTLGPKHGAGGRNQELALAALTILRDDELVLPFTSDGHDNTDYAGAIGDETTQAHAKAHNLSADEYLDAHRAYDFFTATNDALSTGYTGSNVSDLIIAMKK